MKCKEFTGLVPAFLEDSLDDTTLQEFLDHYDGCQGCREEVEIQYLIDRVFNDKRVDNGINLEKDLPEYINNERRQLAYRTKLVNAAFVLELTAVVVAVVTAILYVM